MNDQTGDSLGELVPLGHELVEAVLGERPHAAEPHDDAPVEPQSAHL